MGDVISSHLDEAKRDMISARTGKLMGKFGLLFEQQYAVALFNKIHFDIEGGGGPQPQLLQRKIPLENRSIFSGSLFQFFEENKKWRKLFLFVADSYIISCYDSKASHDKRLHPKGTINCAGYKVLTSMEQYLDLINDSLPGVKAKVGSSPYLRCVSQFVLILWHPYAHHYYFCVTSEEEQQKWHAVLQDCVRHSNDGLCEEEKVQTQAFTDSVRLYRQSQGHYGTWEMMCGVPSQILSNLVMEPLLPELRELISSRLRGKLHERQRNWMLISNAVYNLVQAQCLSQYEAILTKCEGARSSLEAAIRKDMDQILSSKEHITNQIRATLLPKAEKLLKVSIQPYISSILDALMEPTSRGFFEVRDLFFRELVDMSKNTLNNESKETVAQHMEKISMLAFHPVKMQRCYEKVEQLSLEGLQERFDVSSPSVFVQRAQILMRKQMDNVVYTFEQILHQTLESQGSEDLCKSVQRCQDRVIKKFDYDSSTVRKRFFQEALLQIFIPYMLKQLSPACSSELPRFQELIFEDFSHFILVNNVFEEVVLHLVMKDIMMAVKEAAVQKRHNLYRDSIVLGSSDPSLHLLEEKPSIDWAGEYGRATEEAERLGEGTVGAGEALKKRRMKQVVSVIQEEHSSIMPGESCMDPAILEEVDGDRGDDSNDGPPDQERSARPKDLENPADMLNGCNLNKAQPEEQHEKEVAGAAGGAPVLQEEEMAQGKASSNQEESLPKNLLSETPGTSAGTSPSVCPGIIPGIWSGSMLKEEAAEPVEQREVDVPLMGQSAVGGGAEVVAGEASSQKEETAAPVELLPEAENNLVKHPEESLESFQPPHNDSGFNSPTEMMEKVAASASLSSPSEELPVVEEGATGEPDSEPRTSLNQ